MTSPDGYSGNFDAEAVAQQARERDGDALAEVIGQLAGYASTCWHGGTGDAVFDSTEASGAVSSTVDWLRAELLAELDERGPQLGLATTEQLLRELEARIRLDYFAGGGGLGYTTVGGRPESWGVPDADGELVHGPLVEDGEPCPEGLHHHRDGEVGGVPAHSHDDGHAHSH